VKVLTATSGGDLGVAPFIVVEVERRPQYGPCGMVIGGLRTVMGDIAGELPEFVLVVELRTALGVRPSQPTAAAGTTVLLRLSPTDTMIRRAMRPELLSLGAHIYIAATGAHRAGLAHEMMPALSQLAARQPRPTKATTEHRSDHQAETSPAAR
jgi:hypothetical protein